MKEILSYLLLFSALFGLFIGSWLDLSNPERGSIFVTLWKTFSYYTTLTNLLVAVFITSIVFFPSSEGATFFSDANVTAAITFYIFSVGVGNYILFGLVPLSFWRNLSDIFAHAITPLLSVTYWIFFANKEGLAYETLPYWLIYPLGYAAYTLIHGHWTSFYPYPFTDVKALGWSEVSVNGIGLVLSVIVGSAVFITIGNRLI